MRNEFIYKTANHHACWNDIDCHKHSNSNHEFLNNHGLLLFALVAHEVVDSDHTDEPEEQEHHTHHKEEYQRQDDPNQQTKERLAGIVSHDKARGGEFISSNGTGSNKTDGHEQRQDPGNNMVEWKELGNVLRAPLEGRRQEPAEGEDKPPKKGSHHGVVEKTKHNDARSVLPAPRDGTVDKLISRTCDIRPTYCHREEVRQRVDRESNSKVNNRSPWILES